MKRTYQAALACSIFAAAGTTATADIFTWAGGDGNWNDHTQWFGPANQFPDSIVDSATISGGSIEVLMTSNIAVGSLNILNGASVFTSHNSLFVSGDTQVNGGSSALVVRDSAALNDFDSDDIYVRNGGFLIIGGVAKMQADESISIESGSALTGTGTIEMNSTTGDLDIVSGAIWAQYNGEDVYSMQVTRTQSSSSRLNWTHPNSGVTVWPGITLDVQIPYTGALGGSLYVSDQSRYISSEAIVTDSNSEVKFSSIDNGVSSSSTIQAPGIDAYGSLRVNGYGTFETPILALRGTGEIVDDSVLRLDTTVTIFDSFEMLPDGEGGHIEFTSSSSTLNIIGGTTLISTGADGQFDLDGFGLMEVNIADDSSLILDVEYLERFESNLFDSVLNIEGALDVVETVQNSSWTNSTGTINLEGGEIQGRLFFNDSLVEGYGLISSTVLNRGTIISNGSTLFFDHLDLGGSVLEDRGEVRAEVGDISSSYNSGGYQTFRGDMYIGNGEGGREVLETNGGIIFIGFDGTPAQLSMNSGRLRGKGIVLSDDTEFETQGVSQIRASGAGDVDWVRFQEMSQSTISGTLEVDGHSMIDADSQFNGEGEIVAINTSKTMTLSNGADLSDVGLTNFGVLAIDNYLEGVGQVSVANLDLMSTSKLQVDLAGENNGVEQDKILVLDNATLDGALELSTVEGYSVTFGETFTILTASSVSGEFSSLDISGLEIGQSAQVLMFDDHVDVLITCRADLHTNGQLNFFDVSAFLNAYSMNDPIADFTNDGVFNFFDVSAFLQSYNAGCP
ncbi:MAG: GC-type dockerin domain-anchored protein [Phycisphaerales bacterium]|nr:GC-type dockerin domain-anchored protein [Phycisphaerales bacterium]